jgi:sugar phosphate isomerase/epimerase
MTLGGRIRFGASLGRWDAGDIVAQLRAMAPVVDAATVFPYPFNMPVPRAVLRQVRDVSHDLGITLLVHGPIWELYTASIYPEVRQWGVRMVERAIDFAVQIDASHITLHPGANGWPDVWPQLAQRAREAQMASFVELAAYAEASGVRVGIENLPRGATLPGYADFAEIFRVLDRIPSVGVTLDVGHVQTMGLDPAALIRRLGPRLNHLHVHDNHGEGDEHLPVGEGAIRWAPLCRALVEIDYHGVLEVERSLADGGVRRSIARLRRYLGHARPPRSSKARLGG